MDGLKLSDLTHRQNEVLDHLKEGKTNKEIADALSVSIETIKEHVQILLHKTECANRTALAVWVVRQEHNHGKKICKETTSKAGGV